MRTIKLTQNKKTIVDDGIYSLLNSYKWQAFKTPSNYYVCRDWRDENKKDHKEFIHWYVIWRPLKKLQVDHINGDGLDNRLSNLRIVTDRENKMNMPRHRRGKLCGTYYCKNLSKWGSQIKINGKSQHIGYFISELEAHDAYSNYLRIAF